MTRFGWVGHMWLVPGRGGWQAVCSLPGHGTVWQSRRNGFWGALRAAWKHWRLTHG